MVNSVDPNKTVPKGAIVSGSALFAQIYQYQYLEVYGMVHSVICKRLSAFSSSVITSSFKASFTASVAVACP